MFFWIVSMIVEFFASVTVADVAPVVTTDGVVFVVAGCEYRAATFSRRVVDEWFYVDAVELLSGKVAEFR